MPRFPSIADLYLGGCQLAAFNRPIGSLYLFKTDGFWSLVGTQRLNCSSGNWCAHLPLWKDYPDINLLRSDVLRNLGWVPKSVQPSG